MDSENVKDVSLRSKKHLEAYAKNQIQLLKFEMSSKLARFFSFIILGFFLSLLMLVLAITLSVALGVFLGKILENYALAFLIVGGLHLILSLTLYLFRNKLFKNPLLRMFIKEI